jgi:membrane-bound lytic murein transglycosylase D
MWQFVKFRGQQYGLMEMPYLDDRLDPEKATRSAARHCGICTISLATGTWPSRHTTAGRQRSESGGANRIRRFWELRQRRVLPLETTNYVPIILAMTIWPRTPRSTIWTAWFLILHSNTTSLRLPRPRIWPWWRFDGHSGVGDTGLESSIAEKRGAGRYHLNVPWDRRFVSGVVEAVPADRRASWRVHKVERKLWPIGKQYGASPSAIAAANRMASETPGPATGWLYRKRRRCRSGAATRCPAIQHGDRYGSAQTELKKTSRPCDVHPQTSSQNGHGSQSSPQAA